MESIIQVKNFTKKYGSFTAVDNVSFEVERGSIFAFLGPNGAGKSTTINTLCTIIDKTSGELKINGREVSKEKSKVRNDIGIVFQECTLDIKLTIEKNIKLHYEFYNVPKPEIKGRVDFVLELVHYPKVLFLDEPTKGLDPQTRLNIMTIIDHGKKVAYDTPHNLKREYTSKLTKIKVSDNDSLIRYLKIKGIEYTLEKDIFKI